MRHLVMSNDYFYPSRKVVRQFFYLLILFILNCRGSIDETYAKSLNKLAQRVGGGSASKENCFETRWKNKMSVYS